MKQFFLNFIIILTFTLPCLAFEKIVVLTEDWPPYNYKKNEKIVGISTDLVITVLNKAGFDYNLEIYPWKRAYFETLKNPNTLLYTTSRTKNRENLFKWVGPLFPRQIVLYKLKTRNNIIVNNIKDLKKYRLGILRGGSVEEYLKSLQFTNYESVTKEIQNILKLFAKRVDLIPGSDISMAFRMKETKYNFSDLKKEFILIDQGGYYIAINKSTSDKIVNKLQNTFKSLNRDDLINKITKKYLGN